MADSRFSMFNDRRRATDRRLQSLSIPEPLDRRNIGGRRQRNFQSKPWWLSIEYCDEFVSAQELRSLGDVKSDLKPKKDHPSDNNNVEKS